MSSFDPDDTTPLINPNNQDNNVNHGTFNGNENNDESLEQGAAAQGVASDDEMIDRPPRTGFQRFNPFDRVPNLPPQLVDELGASVTIAEPENNWSRFKRWVEAWNLSSSQLSIQFSFDYRFFSFNSHSQTANDQPPLIEEGAGDDDDIIIRPEMNRSINSSSGNNILNLNLSGSFREENELPNDDDDEILDTRVHCAPRNSRKHRSAPNILTSDQPSTSYNVPSSSFAASPNDRLGVAAIPNVQFDASSQNNNFN